MAETEMRKKKLGEEAGPPPEVLGGEAERHRLRETNVGGDGEKADSNVIELKNKVSRLVNERFGGDYKKAFDHYDGSHDGGVNKDELIKLLKDADVGNGLTRGVWASKIIEKMDTDKDGKIQWAEFEHGIKG